MTRGVTMTLARCRATCRLLLWALVLAGSAAARAAPERDAAFWATAVALRAAAASARRGAASDAKVSSSPTPAWLLPLLGGSRGVNGDVRECAAIVELLAR